MIVPAGPGEDCWRGLLPVLQDLGADWEVILSAAESLSGAAPESMLPNIRRITGPAGRARQLNRGIRAAAADWLWLLHADCRPDARALATAADHVQSGGRLPGYFRLRFAADGPVLARLNGHGANLRSRLFALPFGDQGWLLPRELVVRLDGFDESLDRGEDLDFAVRARAAGSPLTRLPGTVTASARRYRKQGWLHTTWENARLTWQLTRASRRRIREARA